MSTVRLRRLKADSLKLQEYVRRHPRVRLVQMDGDPPERYQLEYRINSLRKVADELHTVQSHLVEVTLPRNYPRTPPQCRMLSPVFHPNIAPHAICVGDHWGAGESLESIIIRIGEMLAYQSYNVKSPLNGEAARWVEENKHRVPLDRVSLLPEEDGTERSPAVGSSVPDGASVAVTSTPGVEHEPIKPASQTPATGRADAAGALPATSDMPAPGIKATVAEPVQVQCPECATAYRVAATILGKNVRCKKCGHVFACSAASLR